MWHIRGQMFNHWQSLHYRVNSPLGINSKSRVLLHIWLRPVMTITLALIHWWLNPYEWWSIIGVLIRRTFWWDFSLSIVPGSSMSSPPMPLIWNRTLAEREANQIVTQCRATEVAQKYHTTVNLTYEKSSLILWLPPLLSPQSDHEWELASLVQLVQGLQLQKK